MSKSEEIDSSRLLKSVEALAIAPKDAKDLVRKYRKQLEEGGKHGDARKMQDAIADKIVSRYAYMATTSGSLSALPGVIPGLGTLALAGTALGDATLCMKFQVDMAMCLAETYGYDLNGEDARHLSFLIAAGGTLQKAGGQQAVRIGSKAGVKMLQQYLKGATLQAVKEFFKKLGIVFTRKALEKAIPFGIGVVVGGTANYAMTKYVGTQAKKWFVIDRDG